MGEESIIPFQNESDTLQIGDLTIENRLDRVSIYGGIDLTRDKNGLADARQLQNLLDRIVAELEGTADLPDRITIEQPDTVGNPFA